MRQLPTPALADLYQRDLDAGVDPRSPSPVVSLAPVREHPGVEALVREDDLTRLAPKEWRARQLAPDRGTS